MAQSTTENAESSRSGACATCRARKVKCSGDKPVCAACAKHKQECVYPLHISRKRKDRPSDGNTSRPTGLKKKIEDALISGSAADLMGETGLQMYTGETSVTRPDNDLFLNEHAFGSSSTTNMPGIGTQPLFDTSAIQFSSAPTLPFNRTDPLPSNQPSQPLDVMQSLEAFFTGNDINDVSFLEQAGLWGLGRDGYGMNFNPSQAGSSGHSLSPKQSRSKYRVPYFSLSSPLGSQFELSSGPTAAASGYRQVIATVSAPGSPGAQNHLGLPDLGVSSLTAMEPNGEYPTHSACLHLLPLFQLHFSYAFPSVNTSVDYYRNLPSHLVNIMCALASRYSTIYAGGNAGVNGFSGGNSELHGSKSAHTWAAKAKEQVHLQLAVPSLETVETLLLLSWYEFGQDRDSGLWMYSGMAARMGQDLGLDSLLYGKLPNNATQPDIRQLNLACSVYMLDCILTMGTGRPGMWWREHAEVSVQLPDIVGEHGQPLANPLHWLVRVFTLVAKVTRVLVLDQGTEETKALLQKPQERLNELYISFPPELRFETSTFKSYAAVNQGGAFTQLHLWLHCAIIFAYQPSLTDSDLPTDPRDEADSGDRVISASSAKSILDMTTFAELVGATLRLKSRKEEGGLTHQIDTKSFTQPWVAFPLFTAGRTFLSQSLPNAVIEQLSASSSAHSHGSLHIGRLARSSFQKCLDVLGHHEKYWAGARYLRTGLDQKGQGIVQVNLDRVDDEDTSPQVLPNQLSEWLAEASNKGSGDFDFLGFSFTGTMNSPTDNRLSLISPMKQGGL